jgi:hypothetical protein
MAGVTRPLNAEKEVALIQVQKYLETVQAGSKRNVCFGLGLPRNAPLQNHHNLV